jgi:hypothetical protein
MPWYAASVWHGSKGEVIESPPALAVAIASGEAVVDPEGDPEDTGRNIKTAPPTHRPSQEQPPPTQ